MENMIGMAGLCAWFFSPASSPDVPFGVGLGHLPPEGWVDLFPSP